ncbi:peptidase U35 phage prohead HK97 [Rhizobium sp. PDO1-076]|uniref:prohead protease/major capsid protein fusion protein n=1 Tax=Rhizobium sp. PDO1-076 TaxID=1125979 RepID=UPI00024E2D8D|nr:prohead protease/major capsid protein fusion protein [Rhizobium sp. PDO1-076]EHS49763.1 peptidase U35 phage prohead HK97 [Rhizobium sp. PDO1-076]
MTELLTRAQTKLSTFNAEARTVEIVLGTENAVRRRSWESGSYDEILVISRQAINTERLAGMPLLDSHDAYSGLDSRLGSIVAESLRFEGKTAIVTAKISRNAKGEALFRDLEDGHVMAASVGYRIDTQEKTEPKKGEVAVVKATRWTPMELSIVSVPADPAATTRALESEGNTDMTDTQTAPQARAERKRIKDIHDLARLAKVGLDTELVGRAVDDGLSIDQFRAALTEHQIAEEEKAPTFPIVETRGMRDAQETTRTLMANAMMHRHGLTSKLEDGANQFRDMTPVDLAREVLQQRGENHRGPASEVIRRSLHSTSDFPIILGDITRQTLMGAYSQIPNTYALIATRNVVPDLRDVKVIDVSGTGPALELLTEKGEYKRGTVKESQESFSMAHYGKVIGLSEAMLINDQLGAFTRLVQSWAISAARLEGDIAWNVILQNQVLRSDNKALFHADHGNLATMASALNEGALIAGRTAMRMQTDIDGQRIALAPAFLAVGTDNEVPAQKLIQGTTAPVTTDQVVPEGIKNLTPIYEYRIDSLSSKAFFMFADPAETMGRGLQYAVLAGFETPRLKQREGFDYDGMEFRLDHYFGAGLTDFRFAYYNPGPA